MRWCGLSNVAELSPRVRAEFFADAEDWHANAAETSLMMAVAPELVRPEKSRGPMMKTAPQGLVFTHPVTVRARTG